MRIGVIGGPFYWDIWEIQAKMLMCKTPYGEPSDPIFHGKINDHDVFTLLRHGSQNQFSPNEIPYLANIYSLGLQKPDFVIQTSACGSLIDEMDTGDIFIFDQIIDYTKQRPTTFGKPLLEKVHHLNLGHPVSNVLCEYVHDLFSKQSINHRFRGTMLTEEGPRFSTKAESNMYRLLGADAINQTSCPELYLLRELGIPVVSLSLVTNKVDAESQIDAAEISSNIANNKRVIPNAIKHIIESITDDIVIDKPNISAFDTSKFDLRAR